jgi:hypothetical protein
MSRLAAHRTAGKALGVTLSKTFREEFVIVKSAMVTEVSIREIEQKSRTMPRPTSCLISQIQSGRLIGLAADVSHALSVGAFRLGHANSCNPQHDRRRVMRERRFEGRVGCRRVECRL